MRQVQCLCLICYEDDGFNNQDFNMVSICSETCRGCQACLPYDYLKNNTFSKKRPQVSQIFLWHKIRHVKHLNLIMKLKHCKNDTLMSRFSVSSTYIFIQMCAGNSHLSAPEKTTQLSKLKDTYRGHCNHCPNITKTQTLTDIHSH